MIMLTRNFPNFYFICCCCLNAPILIFNPFLLLSLSLSLSHFLNSSSCRSMQINWLKMYISKDKENSKSIIMLCFLCWAPKLNNSKRKKKK